MWQIFLFHSGCSAGPLLPSSSHRPASASLPSLIPCTFWFMTASRGCCSCFSPLFITNLPHTLSLSLAHSSLLIVALAAADVVTILLRATFYLPVILALLFVYWGLGGHTHFMMVGLLNGTHNIHTSLRFTSSLMMLSCARRFSSSASSCESCGERLLRFFWCQSAIPRAVDCDTDLARAFFFRTPVLPNCCFSTLQKQQTTLGLMFVWWCSYSSITSTVKFP